MVKNKEHKFDVSLLKRSGETDVFLGFEVQHSVNTDGGG
jgi:hypothetical protein